MTGSDLGDSCGQLTKTRMLPDYSTVPSKRITHTAMQPNFPATPLFLSSNMLQSQKFTLDVINKKKKNQGDVHMARIFRNGSMKHVLSYYETC